MSKSINQNQIHYYQFNCQNNREAYDAPQLLVNSGRVRFIVKEGPANNPVRVVADGEAEASEILMLLPVGLHDDTKIYTLFIVGKKQFNTYQVFAKDADILSRYQKDLYDLPKDDVNDPQAGVAQHQEWE